MGKDTAAEGGGIPFQKNKKAALSAAFRNNFPIAGVAISAAWSEAWERWTAAWSREWSPASHLQDACLVHHRAQLLPALPAPLHLIACCRRQSPAR